MDGRPFADTQASLFSSNQVFNAVLFDENGSYSPTADGFVMTGTRADGTLNADGTCSEWTTTGGTLYGGYGDSGPIDWGSNAFASCSNEGRLVCMGKTKTTAVAPAVTTGRKVWVSSTAYLVGAETPDAHCQADRPRGVTTAVALLATTTRAASTLLSPTMNYVRPDGTLVGTGAQLASSETLESGIWQVSSGEYLGQSYSVWTGSLTPASTGSAAGTCGNWGDAKGIGPLVGTPNTVRADWWVANTVAGCGDMSNRLYCAQTAP
jgi:hypothetical protein